MFLSRKIKIFGCFVLLLLWQGNAVGVTAQVHKHKPSPKRAVQVRYSSPAVVWENLVSAIERRDLNVLRTTFSNGMKDGGWSADVYFTLALLSINPAKREYQITKVEADERQAGLFIHRIGSNHDFKISLIKESDGWKFATRKELFAAFDQEIKDRREGKNNDLQAKTLRAPVAPKFKPGSGSGVTRGEAQAIVTKPTTVEKPGAPAPPTSSGKNDKSSSNQADDGPYSLIGKLIQDKLLMLQKKEPIVIEKDYSSPTTTLKTVIAAAAFFDLEVGNESYSAKVRDRFKNLPKGSAGSLALVLSSYQGQIIRDASEIGDEQINDKTARVAVKSYVSGKWYWLSFVKEDGWKLDLEASDFIQKAQSPTTKFDELFFDLLDFANRIEK